MKKLLPPVFPAKGIIRDPEFMTVPGTTPESVGVYALFRKRFTCVPGQKLTMEIACPGRYHFTLNSAVIGCGPARGTDFRLFYDSYDLSPELKEGENELQVEIDS